MDESAAPPPLVSIIMPCFNAGAMLRPALNSALGQTYRNIELIFVDNNSTDASLSVARAAAAETPRPMQVTLCPEQGVNHARNLGYGLAKGDFIQWLDADDELAPDKIALQVAAMQADPAVDIAYGDWADCRLEAGKAPAFRAYELAQDDDQLSRTLATVWYPPHLYLIRRAAAGRLQAASAWYPGRPLGTDVEYSAIAALMGLRFRHVKGARVRYNLWSDSQIGSTTAYPRRVAMLGEIWARLRAMPPGSGVTLRPQHRILLEQTWDIWRMPAGSVTVATAGGRRRLARHVASGRELEIGPREAELVRQMMASGRGLANLHAALGLAPLILSFGGDHAAIVQALGRLQAAGLMEKVAVPKDGA
jgi:hypothetical protein